MLRFSFFFFPTVALCVCVCVFSNSKEFDTPRSTVPCLWRCCCGPTFTASLCIVCKQCALRVFVTYLCANHFPVVTVAGVAVVVPLGAVQLGVSVDGAGFPCNCRMRKSNQPLKLLLPAPHFIILRRLLFNFLFFCRTFVAVRARPVRWTQAAVPVDLVHAGGPEGARGRLALVNICQRRRAAVRNKSAEPDRKQTLG